MKPCPHCQATDPIVYNDALYCGNCNQAYLVCKRVYARPDLKAEYLRMRDDATEVCDILETIFANKQPSNELLEAYLYFKNKAEQYDEWGNT
jgi:hypothetical protein